MTKIALTRLRKEYHSLVKKPIDCILAAPSQKSIFKWYFVIYNLKDCPYDGGFYMGEL